MVVKNEVNRVEIVFFESIILDFIKSSVDFFKAFEKIIVFN